MLVLTRKSGETIVIPDLGVTVKILRVQGERVSVGIHAERKHTVLRGEISGDDKLEQLERSKTASWATW